MNMYTHKATEEAPTAEDQVYESINIVFFQDFFTDFTKDVLGPLLGELSGTELNQNFTDINIFEDSDILSIAASIMDIEILEAGLNDQLPIFQLEDNMAKFQFENLTFILQADYSYVSDPPLFADIGTATILLSGLSLSFEF